MFEAIRTFGKDQSGAITVDWVVLTAAVCGLGLATMTVISGGVESVTVEINQELCDIVINGDFDLRSIPEAADC